MLWQLQLEQLMAGNGGYPPVISELNGTTKLLHSPKALAFLPQHGATAAYQPPEVPTVSLLHTLSFCSACALSVSPLSFPVIVPQPLQLLQVWPQSRVGLCRILCCVLAAFLHTSSLPTTHTFPVLVSFSLTTLHTLSPVSSISASAPPIAYYPYGSKLFFHVNSTASYSTNIICQSLCTYNV